MVSKLTYISFLTYQFSLLTPRVKHVADLVPSHLQALVHDLPCFAETGHDSMLNTIMYHLHKVATPASANIGYTGTTLIILGRDPREKGKNLLNSPFLTTRHKRWAISSSKTTT